MLFGGLTKKNSMERPSIVKHRFIGSIFAQFIQDGFNEPNLFGIYERKTQLSRPQSLIRINEEYWQEELHWKKNLF